MFNHCIMYKITHIVESCPIVIFLIALFCLSATYIPLPEFMNMPTGLLNRENVPMLLFVADPDAKVGYDPAIVTTSRVDDINMRIA